MRNFKRDDPQALVYPYMKILSLYDCLHKYKVNFTLIDIVNVYTTKLICGRIGFHSFDLGAES